MDVLAVERRLEAASLRDAMPAFALKSMAFICKSAEEMQRVIHTLEQCHLVASRTVREASLRRNPSLALLWGMPPESRNRYRHPGPCSDGSRRPQFAVPNRFGAGSRSFTV